MNIEIRLDDKERIILSYLYDDYFAGSDIQTDFIKIAPVVSLEGDTLYTRLSILTEKGLTTFISQSGCQITTVGILLVESHSNNFNAKVVETLRFREKVIRKIANKLNRDNLYSTVTIEEIEFEDKSDKERFSPHWTFMRGAGLLNNESTGGILEATYKFWEYYDDMTNTSKNDIKSPYRYDIFIVHADEDKDFTEAFGKQIQKIFNIPSDRIFTASDSKSIPLGEQWYSYIVDAHKFSKIGIVLLTPNSVSRPWVNFEVGGFVLRNTSSPISICCCKETVDKIEFPISGLQYRKLYDKSDREAIIEKLAKLLECPKPTYNDSEFEQIISNIRLLPPKINHEVLVRAWIGDRPTHVSPSFNKNDYYWMEITNKSTTPLHIESAGIIDCNGYILFLKDIFENHINELGIKLPTEIEYSKPFRIPIPIHRIMISFIPKYGGDVPESFCGFFLDGFGDKHQTQEMNTIEVGNKLKK